MSESNWEYVNDCVRKGVEMLPQKACGALWALDPQDLDESGEPLNVGCFWGAALAGHFGSLSKAKAHLDACVVERAMNWDTAIEEVFGVSRWTARVVAEANDHTSLSREEIGFGLKTGQLTPAKIGDMVLKSYR